MEKRWVERASKPVEKRLRYAPRSGAPDRITVEQWLSLSNGPIRGNSELLTSLQEINKL